MNLKKLTDVLPTCERCRHWRELTDAGDTERYGECGRFPPKAVLTDEGIASIRPLTTPDETCGEFGAGQ